MIMSKLSTVSKLHIVKEILIKGTLSESSVVRFMGGKGAAGIADTALLKAYSKLPWLRAAFGKVADGVAAAPWYMEAVVKGDKHLNISALKHGSFESRAIIRKIVLEDAAIKRTIDHPLLELLANPNPYISGNGLMKLTQLHQELTGEALWWIEEEGGKPVRLWPIPPNWIAQKPSLQNKFDHFELTVEGMPRRLSLDEVVWFRDPDPADPYERSVGTAEPIADELAADEYAAKHVKAWFHNHARPDLLISGTGLDKDEADRAEERWLQKLRGYLKVGRPHFIGSEVKVQELGRSFVDMQLVQLRKFQRDIVIQSLGLPPEIMGIIESSNRSTINAASYVFSKWVLIPRLDRIRETIQTQLVPKYDERYVLMYASPVEEDREFRLDVMKVAPHSWTIDDWRAVVGDDPFPNGQGQVIVIPNASSLALASEITEWESPYTQEKDETKVENGGKNE